MVSSGAFSKGLPVAWLPGACEKEPPALDTLLFRGLLKAHVTLQLVLRQHAGGCHPSLEHPHHSGVGGVRGRAWVAVVNGQSSGRTACNGRFLGEVGVQAHQDLRGAVGFGGMSFCTTNGHGMALGMLHVPPEKTIFVSDGGKLTGFGLYHTTQAHTYGGGSPRTTLTRP